MYTSVLLNIAMKKVGVQGQTFFQSSSNHLFYKMHCPSEIFRKKVAACREYLGSCCGYKLVVIIYRLLDLSVALRAFSITHWKHAAIQTGSFALVVYKECITIVKILSIGLRS